MARKLTKPERFYLDSHRDEDPKKLAEDMDLDVRTVKAALKKLPERETKQESVVVQQATSANTSSAHEEAVRKQGQRRLDAMQAAPGVTVLTEDASMHGDELNGNSPFATAPRPTPKLKVTDMPGVHKIYPDRPVL